MRRRMTAHLQPLTVAQYGIGPIGAEIARLLLTKKWLQIVAAVDIDPNKIGQDLGEVIGLGRETGVKVTRELPVKADVVCHSTGSRLRDVAPQLRELLERGCHVVSTCEELSYPLDVELREELQHVARANNVALLGTGVNPGFVMDKLPLTITSVCQDIQSVEILRFQNASTRREPLQRKVGAGMTVEEFRAAVDAGKIKHMGLKESLMMVGNGLGVEFEHVTDEKIEPIVAEREVVTQYLKVAPGRVAGVHQTIEGRGRIHVTLELRMYVGAEPSAILPHQEDDDQRQDAGRGPKHDPRDVRRAHPVPHRQRDRPETEDQQKHRAVLPVILNPRRPARAEDHGRKGAEEKVEEEH
jgi:hypothetical protein